MLLTDVSFELEARNANVCIYVANRQVGAWACRLASPADYCVCPVGDAWQDFIADAKLSLVSL
jgi:hypothetical protein